MAWLASKARPGAVPDTWQAEVVGTREGRFIATVIGLSRDEAEANARKMAAAPAMVEALKKAWYELSTSGLSELDELVEECSTAIAAATGEQT